MNKRKLHFLMSIFCISFITSGNIVYPEDSMKTDHIFPNKNISPEKLEGAEFVQLDNGFHVWTKRIGHGPIQILTLHGGPGCTHEYFECFEEFFPKEKYQIIFYDQLGSYYSDQPEDTSLWTIDRFCEEVEQVRKALDLENFYLYGQSWGGLLAIEYALKYQHHLKGVVLSNITGSVASYVNYLNRLREILPDSIQETLRFFEEKEDFLNPEYEKLMFEEVYSRHLCKLKPWPEPLLRTFAHLNTKVYQTIQGPNEFVVTGNFKNWDRWQDLKDITIPALIICGRFDTMNPQDIVKMGELMPNASIKICENGSHCTLFDDQEVYFQTLNYFFNAYQ